MAIVYTMFIYMLSSCITVFDPPANMKDTAGILVVEGVILEEGTKITLSRTVKLNEESLSEFYLFADLNRATIQIIDENLHVIAVATQESNYTPYIVKERISFIPGMKYALDIHTIDNKHYRSAFVEPVHTPEIDEVTYQIKEDNSIDIMVSTHNPTNETLYCLWSFEENWEIASRYLPILLYDPINRQIITPSLYGYNKYYCWASLSSQSLMLASSEKFGEAVIRNHKIHTLQPGTSRYSYLYSINVSQYQLNQETYMYFYNLQKNMDESGSLFAPQPSEITGNIQCLSDPDEPVIGYIFASKATTSRIFIPMTELRLNLFYDDLSNYGCSPVEFAASSYSINDLLLMGWGYYGAADNGNHLAVSGPCADCTERGLGSPQKTKPDFWPNNHQ